MTNRARLRITAGLLVGFMLGLHGSNTRAQPTDCSHRDAKGNCVKEPIFSDKVQPPRQPPRQKIIILSEPPGATVWLDGEKQDDKTPLTLEKKLPPGKHLLEVEIDNHETHTEWIDVENDDTQRYPVTLQPWPVLNLVYSKQSSAKGEPPELTINGVSRGAWLHSVHVPPGYHYIEVTRGDYLVHGRGHNLEAGKEYSIPVKDPGFRLEMQANLPGLDVYFVPPERCKSNVSGFMDDEAPHEGIFQGATRGKPLEITRLPPGDYCIKFKKPEAVIAIQRRVTVQQDSFYYFEFVIPDFTRGKKEKVFRIWGEWQENAVEKECKSTVSLPPASRSNPANKELATACFRLGLHLHTKAMKTKSSKKSRLKGRAMSLYNQACILGERRGCEAYGWMLETSDESSASKTRAKKSYKKACERDLKRACYRMYLPPDEQHKRNPADSYELTDHDEIPVHDSLVYEPLLAWRLSSRIKKDLGIAGSVEIDIPGSVMPRAGKYLGANSWVVTFGLDLGVGSTQEGPPVIAAGAVKLKGILNKKWYAAIEARTDLRLGLAAGFRIPHSWLSRAWVVKVGGQVTKDIESPVAFVSIGPTTGWLSSW